MFFSCKSVTKEKGKRKLRLADLDKYLDTSSTTIFFISRIDFQLLSKQCRIFPFLPAIACQKSSIEEWAKVNLNLR